MVVWAVVLGCKTSTETVYVRLTDVPLEALAGPGAPPVPPAPIGGGEARIPRLEERSLYLGELKGRRAAAMRALEENNRLAVQQLVERLSNEFEEGLIDFERGRRAAMAPVHRAAWNDVYERARSVFELYARQIAPLRFRLTLLEGFPDRGDGGPEPDADDYPRVRRAQEAREARAQIAALDAAYRQDIARLVREAQAGIDADVAALQEELIERRDRFLRELDENARKLSREQFALLDEDPAAEQNVSIPATRGAAVRLGPRPQLPSAPQPSPIPDERRRWLRHDLDVWLRMRGYRLAPSAVRGARDATKEFLAWRAEHRPGR
jgi:hypothetical protein